jgi:hypothetical protein
MQLPDLPWLPDPIQKADRLHYKPLTKLLAEPTTDSEQPSANVSTVTAEVEELQVYFITNFSYFTIHVFNFTENHPGICFCHT